MDLVKLMEGKSASRSSIIAAVKARAAAARLKLQYLEREKEEMLELSRLKCEQEAEEAKARCKAQIETYGISHPVVLPVVSCENSYPAGHFDNISSCPSCNRSTPVSQDIPSDSVISSSCLSNPVSQTPVDHDSLTVKVISFTLIAIVSKQCPILVSLMVIHTVIFQSIPCQLDLFRIIPFLSQLWFLVKILVQFVPPMFLVAIPQKVPVKS